jgi:hypothetical protein
VIGRMVREVAQKDKVPVVRLAERTVFANRRLGLARIGTINSIQ